MCTAGGAIRPTLIELSISVTGSTARVWLQRVGNTAFQHAEICTAAGPPLRHLGSVMPLRSPGMPESTARTWWSRRRGLARQPHPAVGLYQARLIRIGRR
jgi:hypothetical protein